jgi:DNA (cytosine-5)-methyltransferase 1
MIFKLGELFCGPGGIALGALQASDAFAREYVDASYGIQHGWANDNNFDTCQTYIKNIVPQDPEFVICKNVQDLNIQELPKVDGFAFGFPCNDFSLVGERKGLNGGYGPLYTYGKYVLDYHQPMWFIAENVNGLVASDKGEALKTILSELSQSGVGYTLSVHRYHFEEYGVPQRRHRIIIVGIRKDLDVVFRVPKPTHTAEQFVTAEEALKDIPLSAPNQELTKQSLQVINRLRHIRPGENAWTATIPPEYRLNVRGAHLSQIYKRLHPDQPAYTITGSGGGGTHVYHWSEHRALTNRERARLQSFPDNFEFVGSKESVRRQIGMAVPPAGAKIIFLAILKSFAGINYPSVDANLQ